MKSPFKKKPRVPRQGGWYSRKSYSHFDVPLSFDEARALVSAPASIAAHQFFPFLTFTKEQRRFTQKGTASGPKASVKKRQLAMPAHRDGYVFAWYSQQLSISYEAFIQANGLDDSVLAYRSGRGTNISMAEDAFSEIARRTSALAVALDLKEFFPSISHSILKANWSRLLALPTLPPDHFSVFRAMTRFSEVRMEDCYARLNIDAKDVPKPLCSASDFREKIRGRKSATPSLVVTNQLPHGIPQGAQISALLSNVSMMDFDIAMKMAAVSMGGSYRRYSDDILFIVDSQYNEAYVVGLVERSLALQGPQMMLNGAKTESVYFSRSGTGALSSSKPGGIKYLGFSFDGARRMIRAQTLSKYATKLALAARGARKAAAESNTPIHKRGIYRRFSHLGKSNFISNYVERSKATMPGDAIRRQVRRHMRRIHEVTKPRP